MENISKQVLLSNGKIFGYILDVALENFNKIGYYVADRDFESEFLIKNEDILKISEKFVLVQEDKFEFIAEKPSSLIGKEVLDENCESLGFIKNLEFKNNKCLKIITDCCEILPRQVKSFKEDVVFISLKRKISKKTAPSFPKIEVDVPVKIQAQPEKIVLSPKFYLGKISTENIFGYNNEKIVLKNEVITKSVIEKAKLHNKLNQLFFAIKR